MTNFFYHNFFLIKSFFYKALNSNPFLRTGYLLIGPKRAVESSYNSPFFSKEKKGKSNLFFYQRNRSVYFVNPAFFFKKKQKWMVCFLFYLFLFFLLFFIFNKKKVSKKEFLFFTSPLFVNKLGRVSMRKLKLLNKQGVNKRNIKIEKKNFLSEIQG